MREINVHTPPAPNGRPDPKRIKPQNGRAAPPYSGAAQGEAGRPAAEKKRKKQRRLAEQKKRSIPVSRTPAAYGEEQRPQRDRPQQPGQRGQAYPAQHPVQQLIPPAQKGETALPRREVPPPAPRKMKKERRIKDEPPAPKRRITRAEARRSRFKKRLWTLLAVLLLIGVGVYISVTLVFKIGRYELQGECAYTLEELTAAFGHEQGESIFAFHIAEAEAQLAQKLPYLENVKVRRRLPDTVVFIVTPAQETYCAPATEGFVVLSEQFKILRTAAGAPPGLCRLEGITAKSAVAGTAFQAQAQEKQALLEELLPALEKSGLTGIGQIDLTDSYNLWFTLNDEKIKVLLGTTVKLEYKLETVYKLLTDELAPGSEGTLDVSAAPSTGKTIFKQDVTK